MATTTDLDVVSLERRLEKLDDVDLVWMMLILVSGKETPVNGRSPEAGRIARVAFMEIGKRWIPLETFGEAWKQLVEENLPAPLFLVRETEGSDDAR